MTTIAQDTRNAIPQLGELQEADAGQADVLVEHRIWESDRKAPDQG